MPTHFKIVIPSYNSVKWLRKTLDSVKGQAYRDYDVVVIDDASTEEGQREIIEEYCSRYGWKKIFRPNNCGALLNIIDGIRRLEPKDQDVIVLLDGDDWLYNSLVLSKVARCYDSEPVNMTYGQFITYPRFEIGICRPISHGQLATKKFRELSFAFSHLRTFKYKVWKHIHEDSFKDSAGKYYKTAWDLAVMFALFELTGGESCKFINDILYVYNMDNPLNDCVAHKQSQADTALYIRSQPPYRQIFFEQCRHYDPKPLDKLHNSLISFYNRAITPKVYGLAAKKLAKKIWGRSA